MRIRHRRLLQLARSIFPCRAVFIVPVEIF